MTSLQTLPDARFECHGCGGCCRNFSIGPVAEATIRDLEAKGAETLMAENGPESFYEVVAGAEGVEYFFRSQDKACVFLDDSNRCRIHAAYGAQAKPWFCRAFPFALVAGPEGLRLGWRPECEGRHENSSVTPGLDSYGLEVLADAAQYPFRAVFPEGTRLPGGQPLPVSAYPSVEKALIDEALRPRPRFDAVFPALAELLDAVSAALHHGPKQPALGSASPLDALCDVVRAALEEWAREPGQEYFVGGVAAMLDATPRPAELCPEAAAFLRDELANHIFTGAVTVYGGLAAGLGEFLLASLVTRGFAAQGGEPVGVAALNKAWTRWYKGVGWRDARGCFAQARGELEALFFDVDLAEPV